MVEQKLAFAHASFQGACKLRLPDFTRSLTPEINKVIFFVGTKSFGRLRILNISSLTSPKSQSMNFQMATTGVVSDNYLLLELSMLESFCAYL